MASSSGSSGLDPMVSLLLSQLSTEQKTQLASFIRSPGPTSDPETQGVTEVPTPSPFTDTDPGTASITPKPAPGLGSSGSLGALSSVPTIGKKASPEDVPEPLNQPTPTGESEDEKAGNSFQERQEPPEGTLLETWPTMELKPTTVNLPGSRVSLPENPISTYSVQQTRSPTSGTPSSLPEKPDKKVPEKVTETLESPLSLHSIPDKKTEGSGGEEDSNERTTETGSDTLGLTLDLTDSTEVPSSGQTSSATPDDSESGRTKFQMPFRKDKRESPQIPSQEVSSSSTRSSDDSSCSSGSESSSSGSSSGDKPSPRDPPEKVAENSATLHSEETNPGVNRDQQLGASLLKSSIPGPLQGVSPSGTHSGVSPGEPSGMITSTESGAIRKAATDLLVSSLPTHSTNVEDVDHQPREEPDPPKRSGALPEAQYHSASSTPESQTSVQVYISPGLSPKHSGGTHSPGSGNAKKGLRRDSGTEVGCRKQTGTVAHPSPEQVFSGSPSLSGSITGVTRAVPGRESPISTLNWSSDSSRQGTVLMSSSPAFSLPGE